MIHPTQDTIKKILYTLTLISTLTLSVMLLPMSPDNDNIPYQRPQHPPLGGIDPILYQEAPQPLPGISDLLDMHHDRPREHNRTIVLDEQTCIALIRALVRSEMQQEAQRNESNRRRDILYQFRDYPVLGLISLAYEQYPQLTVTLLVLATGTALWHYDKIIELYQKTKEKVMKVLLPKKPKTSKKQT